MCQPIFKPGQRVLATVEITCRIPCHESHDPSGELTIWTVHPGTFGTVIDANLRATRPTEGEAVGYVAVRFDSVDWAEPDPGNPTDYLCVAEHQVMPLTVCCRTTGEVAYLCTCPAHQAAYRRLVAVLAPTEAHILHEMQGHRPGAIPPFSGQSIAESLESAEGVQVMEAAGKIARIHEILNRDRSTDTCNCANCAEAIRREGVADCNMCGYHGLMVTASCTCYEYSCGGGADRGRGCFHGSLCCPACDDGDSVDPWEIIREIRKAATHEPD